MNSLSPKYKRCADRIRQLIDEGEEVATLAKRVQGVGNFIQGHDLVTLHSWLSKVKNVIEIVFGIRNPHFEHLQELATGPVTHPYEVYPIVGLLKGALDDLESGFLTGQEYLIAGEVFDSVLERAKYLNDGGFKDASAVLSRVVIEDALKRIAREEGLDDSSKSSRLNEELRNANRYAQPQWRLIQAWLDIGNAAAHGKFSEYNDEDVKHMIEGIERFLAVEFHP